MITIAQIDNLVMGFKEPETMYVTPTAFEEMKDAIIILWTKVKMTYIIPSDECGQYIIFRKTTIRPEVNNG